MGLQPDPEMAIEFRKAIQRDRYRGVSSGTAREAISIYYFQAMLLLRDAQLRQEISAWYGRKGRVDEMKMGQAMSEIRQHPQTPDREIAAFLDSLNPSSTSAISKNELQRELQLA